MFWHERPETPPSCLPPSRICVVRLAPNAVNSVRAATTPTIGGFILTVKILPAGWSTTTATKVPSTRGSIGFEDALLGPQATQQLSEFKINRSNHVSFSVSIYSHHHHHLFHLHFTNIQTPGASNTIPSILITFVNLSDQLNQLHSHYPITNIPIQSLIPHSKWFPSL